MPLDWEQVRQLAATGWQIGSHTCTHPRLTGLHDDELAHELGRSREVVEQELGAPCRSIAYPYGDVDGRVARAAADAGYAFGVGLPARWRDYSDLLQLPRVGIYHGQGGMRLAMKLSPTVRCLRRLVGR